MTKLIALPDIHDKSDALKPIARDIARADAVVLAGDMTNGNMQHLLRLMNVLEEYNEHIYAVPGNMDTDAMLAYLAREGVNLHRTWQPLDGIALCGVGGALPYAGRFVFSEDEIAAFLEDAIRDVPATLPKVLVCHQPPYLTQCDQLPNGQHVGSHALRAFIEQVQPLVCFCGHIHNAVAIDTIGQTHIINPGPIWESQTYAFVEIQAGVVTTAALRQVIA
jgi:hypothetical protein